MSLLYRLSREPMIDINSIKSPILFSIFSFESKTFRNMFWLDIIAVNVFECDNLLNNTSSIWKKTIQIILWLIQKSLAVLQLKPMLLLKRNLYYVQIDEVFFKWQSNFVRSTKIQNYFDEPSLKLGCAELRQPKFQNEMLKNKTERILTSQRTLLCYFKAYLKSKIGTLPLWQKFNIDDGLRQFGSMSKLSDRIILKFQLINIRK